jgi:DeoR family transcriptional regulator, fructose operon transcriptional repressor
MNADERQHQIVASARRHGEVDVTKLSAELSVSTETVRRDLRLLEKHGLLRRTHGGAYPVETAKFETDLAIRTTRAVPEKRRIAAAAVALIGDAETIFIDEGFTPQLIAEALPTDRPLTLVTASLNTAGHGAAARGPGPGPHAGHSGPLGQQHALRLRPRSGVRRRERHLPGGGPHHSRSGGGRR